jgi:hypothetical protein
VLTVLIGILAPFTTFSLVSLLFASDREIVYALNQVVSTCLLSGTPGKNCVAIYELVIGNTGTQEEKVHLTWPFDLSPWKRGQQILNIAADQPRRHDPRISCDTSESQSECYLEEFAPGALVIMKFTCMACSGNDIGMLEEKKVSLETDAKISHGDPRVTTVVRRLENFLNLFL